jgi:hypothetical protein
MSSEKGLTDFPKDLAAPARRALDRAGYTKLAQLTKSLKQSS